MNTYVTMDNTKNNVNSNKGSSLLLVIVAMSFVAIISAVILVLTYKNLESIRTGISGTANFYTAETAMDELKMTFNKWSDTAMRKSYTKWLQRVSGTEYDDRETLFKQLFVSEMVQVLKDEFTDKYFGASPYGDIDDLFVTFQSNIKWNKLAEEPKIVTSDTFDPHTPDISDDTELTVKNISFIYKDDRGLSTTITTDFVFDVVYPGLTVKSVAADDTVCSDYVIIADGQIYNMPTSNVRINGSIYGGGYKFEASNYDRPGIKLAGGQATIYGDNIVSKGDIEVTDGAKLVVKGLNAADDYTGELSYADIWAKGLSITGKGAAGMNIQGNCYINDDTTLSAETDSDISYLNVNGAYYGYNTSNADIGDEYGTPEGSSSVVINSTSNSSVDFTNCDPLWLAGKSFVSVPDQYGYVDKNNVTIPQGDSISYRGLQSAYLLPGDCIIGVGHNPMTDTEYKKLEDDLNNPHRGEGDYFIDLSRSESNGGVKLTEYVNLTNPYRVAYVTYNANLQDKLVYLYLNFTDPDDAARYFKEYEEKFGELVLDRMSALGKGSIKFNPATIISTGNCIGYEKGKLDLFTFADDEDDEKYLKHYYNADVENKQILLSTQYTGMISALDKNYIGVSSAEFLSDSFVNMNKVDDEVNDEYIGTLEGVYENYHFITGKDISINSNVNAIVIATGNVDISKGTNFKGLIVARGDVHINGNYDADPDAVGYLIQNDNAVIPYFKLASGEEYDIGNVDATDIIHINTENWKKN